MGARVWVWQGSVCKIARRLPQNARYYSHLPGHGTDGDLDFVGALVCAQVVGLNLRVQSKAVLRASTSDVVFKERPGA